MSHDRRRDELPDYDGTGVDRDPLYFSMWRAVHRLIDVLDPAPGTPGRRLPMPEVDKIKAARDPQTCERKMDRLLELGNAMLEATIRMQPDHVMKRWRGDICVDATPVPLWGKRGTSTPVSTPGRRIIATTEADARTR